MLPEIVQVMTVDASRGGTARMVYVLKHPGTTNASNTDQHHGMQDNISREYVNYTRARHDCSIWLPKRQPQEPR
eukprot:12910642-Prorocentrum_lima.AAC.1